MRARIVVAALGVALTAIVAPVDARTTATVNPSRDRLVQKAILTASNAGGRLAFDTVAISGPTIVAHAHGLYNLEEAGVYVFTEPARGWSSKGPAADLIAPNQDSPTRVAIASDTVFVADAGAGPQAQGAVYAYSEPPGGWTGTLQPSATLVASDAKPRDNLGVSISASGDAVIATGGGAVYVFNKPVHGWSGTIEQSAKLTPADGSHVHDAVLTGSTVLAAAVPGYPNPAGYHGAVYVFDQPAHGWSGTLHQAATLTPSTRSGFQGTVAAAGTTVVASAYPAVIDRPHEIYLFTKPRGGWSGVRHQQAVRTVAADDYTLGPSIGASGQTVVAATLEPGPNHMCPCGGTLYAFSQPLGGWSGKFALGPSAGLSTASTPAVAGRTVVVGDEAGVHVYEAIAPPSIGGVSIGGMAAGKPLLRFGLAAGAGAAPIQSLTIRLPRGLTFAAGAPTRTRTLRQPARRLTIALAETSTLLRRVRAVLAFNRRHRHKRTLTLDLSMIATDAAGTANTLPVTVTIR